MTTSTIWLSYDLGVRGDYEGLYAWLDSHEAKECGDSVAVLKYSYKRTLVDALKTELSKNITVDKRTRIYVIYRDQDTQLNRGKFIFGRRRAAAWTGYNLSASGEVDDEAT